MATAPRPVLSIWRNAFQIQQDTFLVGHELAHFIAKLHGVFAGEFPVAFDDQSVSPAVAVNTKLAGVEEVLVGHKLRPTEDEEADAGEFVTQKRRNYQWLKMMEIRD